jgi:hypothetical protein
MIVSTLIITGLEMMLVVNYIYEFVGFKDEGQKMVYFEELNRTNFAYKILPQLDFYLRFLIQMIFVSTAIQIFTSYIRRKSLGYVKK